jgi:Fe-S oxidoreductase
VTQAGSAMEAPCLSCPKLCTAVCPAHEASMREAYAPWSKINLMALAGTRRPNESEARTYAACTGCLRCLHHCPHGFDVPKALEEARAAAARAQTAPKAIATLPLRFLQAGHGEERDLLEIHRQLEALAEEARARGRALCSADPPLAAGSAEGREAQKAHRARGELAREEAQAPALLLAGCDALSQGGATALQALAVAEALGAPLALGPEGALCCGEKLAQGGHPELLAAHALRVRSALLQAGGDAKGKRPMHLVLLSPGCARSLQERWPACKAALPEGSVVEHVTTFLARALVAPGAPERPRLPIAVTWHDPCQLARGLREVTAPRALLAAAVEEVREPVRCSDETSCCGHGGLVQRALPELAREMASRRQAELRDCGAPAVTSSPGCARQLGAEELVSVLARWLGV